MGLQKPSISNNLVVGCKYQSKKTVILDFDDYVKPKQTQKFCDSLQKNNNLNFAPFKFKQVKRASN